MAEKKRAEFTVYGRVQGVGYRYFVYRNAVALNLTGYTNNTYDGNVQVVAEGDLGAIGDLHALLKRGPSMSRVDKVLLDISEYIGKFNGFDIS